MRLLFGMNRRQHPLTVTCPGGTVTLMRDTHGVVVVTITASAGEIELLGEVKDYAAKLKLLAEAREG